MGKSFEETEKEVDDIVRAELNKVISENTMGYFYYFEKRKQEILKEKYNIEWKTSRERDAGTIID